MSKKSHARRTLARVVHLCVAVTLASTPGVRTAVAAATAEAPESADELSDRAVAAFDAHDYDTAIALFERAYAIDPQPNYLFNIGRVYEEKGELRPAVEHYQRFLGQSGVDLESREIATERLRVLREALRELEADAPAAPAPAAGPAPAEPADASASPGSDRDDPRRKKNLRIAGYTLLGVGGATLIAGAAVGGVALATKRSSQDEMFVDAELRERERARKQGAAADGLFIAGGVVAAVGLVLVLSTLRPTRVVTARRTTFTGAMGRGGVGVAMTHRF